MFSRSSLSNWSVGSQEAALQDIDYISFLFSTLTGFSSDKLATLQDADEESILPPSPLSPLSLYPTPLEQFTHHWDVVEVRTLHIVFSCTYHKTLHTFQLLQTWSLGGEEKTLSWKLKSVDILDTAVVFQSPRSHYVSHKELRGWKLYRGHSGWEGNLYRVAQVGDAWLSGTADMHKC